MSKNKSAKYKITDTDIDKKFIGKQVTVEKVKSKGGPGVGGRKRQKQRKAPAWFVEFEKRNNQRLDKIENNVSNLNSRFDNLVKVNNLKE